MSGVKKYTSNEKYNSKHLHYITSVCSINKGDKDIIFVIFV